MSIAELFTTEEAKRLKGRREIREQIARCERSQMKVREYAQQLKSLDDRADAAAERHCEATERPQAELAQLEEQILASMADRTPVDPSWENRRVELLRVVEDANAELSLQIAGIDRQREPIEIARHEAVMQTTEKTVLVNALARSPLASRELVLELFVSDQRLAALKAWANNAQTMLEKLESGLASAERRKEVLAIEEYRPKCERWRATASAASAEASAAKAESDELFQRIIDE